MRLRTASILAAMIAVAVPGALPAHAEKWGAGTQREIRTGVYAKLILQSDGWWLWKTENRYGATCRAIKPAKGGETPMPDGYDTYAGGDGAVMLEFGEESGRAIGMSSVRKPTWRIQGADNDAAQAYRILGGGADAQPFAYAPPVTDTDGRTIEVIAGTGAKARRALVDMTGFAKAVRLLSDCDRAYGR